MPFPDDFYPKLRWPLDVRFEEFPEGDVLLIRCPTGITPQPLALIPAVAPLISCFDGRMTVAEIANRFASQGVTKEVVLRLLELLDDHCFLHTQKFLQAERTFRDEFARLETRAAALAGVSYAADPTDLRRSLDIWLGTGPRVTVPQPRTLHAVMSPHIDYNRGGVCYGITYAKARDQQHDVYLLIGTSHQYSEGLFHVSRKHFASPLGTMRCATDLVDALTRKLGSTRHLDDEILHRNEHSLELQVPFLQAIGIQGEILPILVGSFHKMVQANRYPKENGEYDSFVGALTETLREVQAAGRSVCVIAGVDMAHIGNAFGDTEKLNREWLDTVWQRDTEYLATIEAKDHEALFKHIAEDGDKRRICGFPTMYTVLDLFHRLGLEYTVEVFDYRQAVDEARQCAVTFAGAGFYSSHNLSTPTQGT